MTAMPSKYRHVVRAVFETPWAILPSTLSLICDIVRFRAAGGLVSDDEIRERIAAASNGPRAGASRSPGSRIAVLPLYGIISGRQNLMSQTSGGTSLEAFGRDFRELMVDPDIGAVVLDIDSPGGTVDGVEEMAAEVRAARGTKPIVAVANTMAASAAYWIASQADELVVTPSGAVGSIGVFAAHQDLSAAAEKEGVKTTLISAGKYKVEGNEWEPLTDEARGTIQAAVDEFYDMFVGSVAKGRGIAAAEVRKGYGEGRVLLARPALKAGMVDRIATLDDTLRRVAAGKVRPRALAAVSERPAILGFHLMDAATGALMDEGSEPFDRIGSAAPVLIESRWAAPDGMFAGPLQIHHGETDDGPWDGPAEEAKIPNETRAEGLAPFYAWRDPQADPDTKSAYKFIHHFYRDDPGPASTRACSAGIGVLNGARGGANVPDDDRGGIHAHLAAHLKDAGLEAPPLAFASSAVLDTGPPFADRLALVTAEVEGLLEHSRARVEMRAKRGRHLSTEDREQLTALARRLEALAAEPAAQPDDRDRARARIALLMEAARTGYTLPT